MSIRIPTLAILAAFTFASPAMADSSSFVSSFSFSGDQGNSVSVTTRTTGNGTVFGSARAGDQQIVVTNRAADRDARGDAMLNRFWQSWLALFS